MVKQAAHDSWDECSNHSGLNYINIVLLYPSAGTGRQDNLKIYWYDIVNVQVVFRINLIIVKRGHSLIGKTAILHIVISGSSPDVSSSLF